jgi:hypothetical protein
LGIADAEQKLGRSVRTLPEDAMYLQTFSGWHKSEINDAWSPVFIQIEKNLDHLESDQRLYANFALAKYYEDIGEKQKSFDYLLAGNALKRKTIHYDEAATLRVFDGIIKGYSGNFARHANKKNQDRSVIFIVGMPRSGTSLIEQILASHSDVYGAGELADFTQSVEAINKTSNDDMLLAPEFVDPTYFEQLADLYLSRISGLAYPRHYLVDKMPGNLPYAGLIHCALPNAKIIQVTRDPVDTCLSCFSKLFAADLNFAFDLGELGRFANASARFIAHWSKVLPSSALITVNYEDVVSDIEGQARRLIDFCGLDWEDTCLAFHKTKRAVKTASAAQVRQPLYKTSVGRWRPCADQLKPLYAGLGIQSNS